MSQITYRVGAPPSAGHRPRPRGVWDWLGVVQSVALLTIFVFYLAR